jgi:hypothetical protein
MSKIKQLTQHLFRRGQVGQSIVILALGMIALLGFVGLTTDVSVMFVRYNNLRRAVDSAAIAAAGQVRQSSEGAMSDVITRASMAARQFIEFHGLNPRDVWVEMCENQPRHDHAPGTEGLQLEPLEIIHSREAFELAKNNLGQSSDLALRQDYSNKLTTYLTHMLTYLDNSDFERSPELDELLTDFDNAQQAWIADPSNENWEAWMDYTQPTIEQVQQESRLQEADKEVCSEDVRKLVRVTAQVDSPTVFLHILGFNSIRLQASAISETAVLDVVLIMDVSEKMASDTSYEDWAKVNLGMAYLPPFLYGPYTSGSGGSGNTTMPTITGYLIDAGFIPRNLNAYRSSAITGIPTVGTNRFFAPIWDRAPSNLWSRWTEFFPNRAIPNTDGDPNYPPAGAYSALWREWFWLEYIMSEWQHTINQRLNFLSHTSNPSQLTNIDAIQTVSNARPVEANPLIQYVERRNSPSLQYPVRSFQPTTHPVSASNHPREECRVRFFPSSFYLEMVPAGSWPSFPYSGRNGQRINIAQYYVDQLGSELQWNNITNNDPNNPNEGQSWPTWGSFVPTYNFYGCCNDPSTGIFVSDGTENYRDILAGGAIIPNGEFVVPVTSGGVEGVTRLGTRIPSNDVAGNPYLNTSPDQNFADLVCQPFKQAKDATRQFLRRIDFLRGDRVAFVTYDRSAFLVNPDTTNSGEAHMIESYDRAVDTLDRVIGVRAEPNYYVWETPTDPMIPAHWGEFAAGIDADGNSIPLNYGFNETNININLEIPPGELDTPEDQAAREDLIRRAGAAAVNYPSYNNCSVLNALIDYPFSIYATRNAPPRTGVISPVVANDGTSIDAFANYIDSVPLMAGRANPNYLDPQVQDAYGNISDNPWYQYVNSLPPERREQLTSFPLSFQFTYERHSMCAGGNMGAALRAAHSALNDPRTSRRDGSVWIIVLLSDGAVGTTSPVRRNGYKLNSLDPYIEFERFNYQEFYNQVTVNASNNQFATPDPLAQDTDKNSNRYGSSGAEYGAYGLCPFGTTHLPGVGSRLGELVTGDPFNFPWCSKADPFERHFCLQTGDPNTPNGLWNVGFNPDGSSTNAFSPGFQPNARDRDYRFGVAANMEEYNAEIFNATNEGRPPRLVLPMSTNPDYRFNSSQWIIDENIRLNNVFDVDLGDPLDPTNRCDPLYDPYDYARDWADFVTGVHNEDNTNEQLPIIFTIGFGLNFEGDLTCENNIKQCLGEELLRYIADAGDNFQIDNDVQQDMLADRYRWRALAQLGNTQYPTLNGYNDNGEQLDDEFWGAKDPCEPDTYVGINGPSPVWRPLDPDNPTPVANMITQTRPSGSCGNYFNAPSAVELERIFDEIASRMFTRLSG